MDANGHDILSLDAGGVVIRLLPGDRIGAAIARDGTFEPETLKAWSHACCGGGEIAVDVGAYCGVFAIVAAKLGMHAIALEPKPQLAARARKNAKLNGVSIEVVEAAASSEPGQAPIYFRSSSPLTSASSLARRAGDGMMLVRLMRLDELLDRRQRIGAIKIDVEGHEVEVLRGAHKLIEKYQPIVITECLKPSMRGKLKKVLLGYRNAAKLDRRNLIWVPA